MAGVRRYRMIVATGIDGGPLALGALLCDGAAWSTSAPLLVEFTTILLLPAALPID